MSTKYKTLLQPMIVFAATLIGVAHAGTPIPSLVDIESISFFETTGSIHEHNFLVNDFRLTDQITGALDYSNSDFVGTTAEFYDVYYSNEDGTQNTDGEFITVTATYPNGSPAGGGLNIAEIQLNFSYGTEYGKCLSTFIGLGDNFSNLSPNNAVDSDLTTHTTMGSTSDPNERLLVTVSFSDTYCQNQKKAEIKVINGYIKLDSVDEELPTNADCSSREHIGRMVYDSINNSLWMCSEQGWQQK